MIWHIFRKDCRLLWPGIAGIAIAHGICAILWLATDPREVIPFPLAASLASLSSLSLTLLLVVAAVHLDTPARRGQDWQARPIARRDLLFAKLLFAALAAHGPLLTVDIVKGVALGLTFGASAGAACWRGALLFGAFTLPAVAIGTLTRSTLAGIGVAASLTLGSLAADTLLRSAPSFHDAGFEWLLIGAKILLAAVAAGCAAWLLYHSRRMAAMAVLGFAAIAFVALPLTFSWDTALALQRSFTPPSQDDRAVALSFAAEAPRAAGADQYALNAGVTSVKVPLEISGVPRDALLLVDSAFVRISDARGAQLYAGENGCRRLQGYARCARRNFPLRPSAGDASSSRYLLDLPTELYERIRTQPVRLDIDYYLSVLVLADRTDLESGTDASTGPWRCARRPVAAGMLELSCFSIVTAPTCTRVLGADPTDARYGVDSIQCLPNYAPRQLLRLPNLLWRGFPRLQWAASYASAASSGAGDWRFTIESYHARSHFKRHLVLERARLLDAQLAQHSGAAVRGMTAPGIAVVVADPAGTG